MYGLTITGVFAGVRYGIWPFKKKYEYSEYRDLRRHRVYMYPQDL